jgi:Fic family protein
VCQALSTLETRFRNDAQLPLGSKAATFAAMVFFALVDTHAFGDGNGRLARIASNYALKRFGFDMPVSLFATPAQRKEYTQATVLTRRNLYLLARGQVEQEALVQAFIKAGVLQPLVRVFLDRMTKAVGELTKLVQDKQRAVQEQALVQAARMFREQVAAEGTCLMYVPCIV